MLEEKDIEALEHRFDLRYKSIADCDQEMAASMEQHHILDKQYSIINTKLSALLWGVSVIGTALVGVLVKLVFKI